MKRTALQVNLDPSSADAVYRLARKDGVSVAAILRESVERYLDERGDHWEALDRFIGSLDIEGLDSADVDEILAEEVEESMHRTRIYDRD